MPRNERHDAPIEATTTSLRIVDALKHLEEAGVSELSAEMDLPVSTVHDHLKTLEEQQYVVQEDGRYRLGTKFLTLGGYARNRMQIYNVAEPEVKKLARDTGEHANLMIEEHGRGIFLYIATGSDALKLDTYEGMRTYLHTTALGKSILAHLPDERYEWILDRHGLAPLTSQTLSSRDALEDELRRIRERGYATDDGERIEGVRCVAAPVVKSDGTVLGAVSVSAPKSRLQEDVFGGELPRRVQRVANIIEVNATHI
jgi:DNA-binding IclR family transcriptional regulator